MASRAASGKVSTSWVKLEPVNHDWILAMSPRQTPDIFAVLVSTNSRTIIQQISEGDAKRIRQFHQRPNRRVPAPTLQVGQVAPLYRCPFRQHLLGPLTVSPQLLDAIGKSV